MRELKKVIGFSQKSFNLEEVQRTIPSDFLVVFFAPVEWMEEVGVEIEVLDFLLLTKFINNDTEYTLHCHLVKTDSLIFLKNVHEEIIWVTKEELKNLPFGPSDGQIRDYLLTIN